MTFGHSDEIWADYPELVPGVLAASGIRADATVADRVASFNAVAAERPAARAESELPEIQAWRRTFARMGLKPTQYRSASEALLRRYRKEGSLPAIHPLIDLCNAVSLAFAIPVAVFDTAKIGDDLEVRYADGTEVYESFSGETESPDPHEVIFADAEGKAHARRWTNRQSAYSAVRGETSSVLIVAEGMHDSAGDDVRRLVETLAEELTGVWSSTAATNVLNRSSPRFDFG